MMLRAALLALASLALCAQVAKPEPGEVVPWEAHLRRAAGPLWVERAAQVQAESGWRQSAVSPVGAQGPVQAMPTTWRWWQKMGWVPGGATPFDLGACFVGQNAHMLWLRRYWDDLDKRLAAYNAGQGSVLGAEKVARAQALAHEIGWEADDAWLRLGLPRVTGKHSVETQQYVARNARYREQIRARLRLAGRPE